MSLISFESLVPGSAGVRCITIENVPRASIRDIIMVVCDRDNNDAGRIWRNLPETYKSEVQQFVLNFKFPGRGQSEQPVITLQGALKLIMWLPGNMAKDFRSKACDILTRFLAGDQSLHAEINANATSTAPIHEFARASITDPVRSALLEQSVSNTTSLITTNAQLAAANERATLAMVAQVELFGEQISAVNADLEKERHLRHQADGRYGNGIREATKEVRKRAAEADARAVAAEARAAEDRREHHKAIHDAAERAAEDRREHHKAVIDTAERAAERAAVAEERAAEERRAAAASHQLLAETLAKLAARLMQ
jgi:hypothetical protein